ncbi:hypothetical protein Cgig2_017900 [Carnegiea gigantea]|uniref:Inner centromere protein ARK-binding domain-containing protein n=1 Tax=Carnegiea gigantea TaxID=171969 RepID=A0A9Q1JES1_9CARY|nr:hypothetical protein Cgig2_017900 [Carnegiea gigantea]
MSTTEKLFVQIFERKRWIVEHLKQHKLLYNQHLASKLLIQGITPPPWLLNPELPSSTSDLIGPLVSYPSGSCFVYDKLVATVVNDRLTHATCAKTCASSNGSEGDEPSIIPSCHIKDAEHGSGIVPQCHVDGIEGIPNYVPMSPEDQNVTMNSNTYLKLEESLVRMQRSRSRQKALELRNSAKASGKCCLGKENNVGISSGNKTFGYDQPLEGVRKSVELTGSSAFSAFINEEAARGDCLNKEMRSDACSDSSSQSKGKEVQTEDGKKKAGQSIDYVERNARSGSSCPQSVIGGHQNSKKSHEVYIGRMIRSRSGKEQLSENDDPQNRRVTRSCSNQLEHINGNHAIGNSKVDSCRIAKSRSGGAKEAETKNQRSKGKNETKDYRGSAKNDMSVKPKQLDFDDIEEPYLADSPVEGKGNFEEKAGDHNIEERSASLPCSTPAEETSQKRTSLAYERQEVFEIDVNHSLPRSDKIPEQTSLLLDCPPDSTEEHMLGITLECAADPRLSGPNVEISISQKRKFEPEEEQELDKERSNISLPNADTEATMNLHRGAVEATLSPEKTSHELSFCSNCEETSHLSLPYADTEATMSLHPVAVATLNLKKARLELASCSDHKEASYFSLPNTEATVSLPRDVEATLSSEKTRYDSSSRNDCKETSCLTLPSADSAAAVSLHRVVVEATLSSEKTRHELSSRNNSKETSHFSMPNADTEARMSLNRDAVKATSILEQSRHGATFRSDFKALLETQTIELLPPSPSRNSAGSLASMLKFPPVNSTNETRSDHAFEMLKSGSHFRNAGCQTSCFSSDGKVVGCSKLPDVQAGIDVLPEYNVSNEMDGSWPCYKRRKIGYQVPYKSASPSVRVNTFPDVNENIPDKSLGGEEENSSCLPQKLIISEGSDAILSNSGSVARAAHGIIYLGSKEPELTPKVQYEEGKVSTGRSVLMPFTCEQKILSTSRASNVKHATTTESSDYFPVQEAREALTSTAHCIGRLSNNLELAEVGGQGNSTDRLTFVQMTLDKRESLLGADKLKFSIGSPLIERMDVYDAGADEIVPEFERFIIAQKSESVHNAEYGLLSGEIPVLSEKAEFTNLPEQIPGPVSLSTPASPFPTAYKLHFTPGVYRSVPNGLIENIDLTSDMLSNDNALQGKSYSDYCSFPGKRLGRDISIPFISPVGKGFEGISTKSGSSGQRLSSNPELICFPIQEDPETSEEGVDVDDTCDTGINGSAGNSSIREPLRDIIAMSESILASSHAVERGSLESVTTEVSISEKHNKDSHKNEMHLRSRKTRLGKENQSLSIDADRIKKHSGSLSSRYSKPKLSEKSSLRSRGQSLSEKESKRNNIVSNVKSFLPLIQKKQASSVVPAKKEVKVKALEAAEAAKRLAEKRENERKQKKEALKLERARLEQENLKQMELKKKLEEEEKKKREAENAARKRQREEDRKEKERKRKRIEEARYQQKQAAEKISAWREDSRCEIKAGRTHERKTSNDEADRAAERVTMSRIPDELVGSDGRKADNAMPSTHDNKSSAGSSDTGKVGSIDVADISTPNCDKSDKLISQTSKEQSYDISPYQCSDDEEEEEDDVPNKKFIPTWASKSCVAVALSSLKQLDPDTIFPPGSFCSLEEAKSISFSSSPSAEKIGTKGKELSSRCVPLCSFSLILGVS